MNFPIWRLGFPGGLLIAVVAILHVFVSHFAVGGGAFLVLTEQKAYRESNDTLLAYVRRYSKFFALLTVVFGAVTGVGIWFAIGLVSPEATSALIHSFVWGWAIEWVFFFVEITAALIYAYYWDELDRSTHLAIGWIYFVAAWASLAIINGIITFMLTPGRWLQTHNFWDGIFNPTYFPSLAVRTLFAIALAGMWGLATVEKTPGPSREKMLRWAGGWLVIGLAIMPFAGWWYFGKFPAFARDYFAGLVPAATHSFRLGAICAAIAVLLAIVFAIAIPKWMNRVVLAVIIVACFVTLGSGEYVRELVRKPYAINGYIYANGIRVDQVQTISAAGMAASDRWLAVEPAPTVAYGQEVFASQCAACHSVDGYRSIRKHVCGWDERFAAAIVPHLALTRGTMPEFAGNATDAAALGKYLATLAPEPLTINAGDEMATGKRVFEMRCALCHTVGGQRRPLDFAGADFDSVDTMVQNLDSFSTNMPPFTGTEAERHALVNWLRAKK
ncbi:MAG TPA: c-type cytochrome [Terriglobales bacterium]|nr:c-type cytochrome [Terriglobales bacterium]